MNRICEICGATENVEYFLLNKCEYNNEGEITKFIDGGIYLCQKCLSSCDKCEECGKLKPNGIIKKLLSGWSVIGLCNCEYDKEERKFLNAVKNIKEISEQTQKIEHNKKAKKIENIVVKASPEEIGNMVMTCGVDKYILDSEIAKIFEITTSKVRKIITKNIQLFDEESDIYQLNNYDTQNLCKNIPDYITSINPYMFTIKGLFKLAFLINNSKSKKFLDNFYTSIFKNTYFYSSNKVFQVVFDALTYNERVQKDEAKRKTDVQELENNIHELVKIQKKDNETISNLWNWIFIFILVIMFFLFHFFIYNNF